MRTPMAHASTARASYDGETRADDTPWDEVVGPEPQVGCMAEPNAPAAV